MILSKHHYYELYDACYFGNRPRTWPRVLDAQLSDCELFMARSIISGGKTYSYLRKEDLQYVSNRTHRISEQMPDEAIIIQGEYLPPFTLDCSTYPAPMKDAFAHERVHLEGAMVRGFQDLMCQPAKERFNELIDEHGQDHVVEFSIYNKPVGVLGWNTIIWEVRRY